MAVVLRRRLYLGGGSLRLLKRIGCEVLMVGRREVAMAGREVSGSAGGETVLLLA